MEKSNVTKSNYKPYISGLKGFACLMVMLGHYMDLYKYAENFPVDSIVLDFFDEIYNSRIGFFLSETYWVILFFVISGYLVTNGKISTLKTFLNKVFMRFLRLGGPILFAFIIILVIYKVIGFHTTSTLEIFVNPLVQTSLTGEYSFCDVVLSPFKVLFMGEHLLNDPYWCLREMFFTSIIIYFLLWFKAKIKNENVFLLVFFILLIIGLVKFDVMYAGLFGMLVALLEKEENKSFLKNKVFAFFVLGLCAIMRAVPREKMACVFFAALIVLLPNVPVLNKIFSSSFAEFISKISFGIYSFHWPVLCSVGMLILINTYQSMGLLKSCLVVAGICIAITLLLSIVYYYCIERYIYVFLKKIEKRLGKAKWIKE